MNFKNIKKDWWLYNAIYYLLLTIGLLINLVVTRDTTVSSVSPFVIIFNLAIVYALYKRSIIVFWFALITTAISFLSAISTISKNPENLYSIGFYLNVISLGLIIMLWQQIRTEKRRKLIKSA